MYLFSTMYAVLILNNLNQLYGDKSIFTGINVRKINGVTNQIYKNLSTMLKMSKNV